MRKSKNYWTREKCKEESLKYKSRSEFAYNSNSAYKKIINNKWYELISHMERKRKHTKEECHNEALKYQNKKEFLKNSRAQYSAAQRYGWLNEICLHMTKSNNDSKRCIYVYEFNDNHAYIGLTNDLKDRKRRHDKNGTVHNHIKINDIYELKQLTDYLDVEIAKEKEEYYVNYYKKNGWFILNKSKTGSLGSSIVKWTYDECKKEALKYNSRIEFQKQCGSAYNSARKNKWLDDITSHMISTQRKKGFWNFENCEKYALICKSRSEFDNKYSRGYYISSINGWLEIFFLR